MAIYNGTQKIDMSGVAKVYVGTQLVYQKAEPITPYVLFSSPDNNISLSVYGNAKTWDGTLSTSPDNTTWTTWDGTTAVSSNTGKLYVRGSNNTLIIGMNTAYWILTGTDISISGNIEALLDYQSVANGSMIATPADYTFAYLFAYNTNIISARNLKLPRTTLVDYCYSNLFRGCSNLVYAPDLPATTLSLNCYRYMFRDCTSLISAPSILPATTLTSYCYSYMFFGCSSLTTAPTLPATTLATYCYEYMFNGCTNLVNAPSLPATTLADYCYQYMFYQCRSLVTPPTLSATTVTAYCYRYMFAACNSLATAPVLPATTLATYCYYGMFSACTSLTTPPVLPATTLATYCYRQMFYNCSGLTSIPGIIALSLPANSCYQMFYGCSNIKLSTTQVDDYVNEYRIPITGTGTGVSSARTNMFQNTGGTFKGTPSLNTKYYTSNTVVNPE